MEKVSAKKTATTKSEETAKTIEKVNSEQQIDAIETDSAPTNSKGRIIKGVPSHITELACIVKNNAQIRRFTAIGIINYLCQKGEISNISSEEQAKGKGNYVNFLWNKFTVKSNGLSRDYHYTEKFFITALIGSFTSFAANSKEIIIDFLKKENVDFNIE